MKPHNKIWIPVSNEQIRFLEFIRTQFRNGKYKKLTKRPLSKKEADQVAKDIKKANAPSIDSKTIEVKRSK